MSRIFTQLNRLPHTSSFNGAVHSCPPNNHVPCCPQHHILSDSTFCDRKGQLEGLGRAPSLSTEMKQRLHSSKQHGGELSLAPPHLCHSQAVSPRARGFPSVCFGFPICTMGVNNGTDVTGRRWCKESNAHGPLGTHLVTAAFPGFTMTQHPAWQ